MRNYYYSKKRKVIIPFDKVLFVGVNSDNVTFVSLSNVYVKLEEEEDEEFRKAYIEWLEKDNISIQYPK